ncbi:hypothetical protein [Bacillus sp. REN3]|uniref:hypothetical protein n=1 Tax=Bacillus sp. REN3 TaxID=2802440 RepID=UPI001AEDFB9C|nr:hypothetical protein [Bacillus sp. REN3]
MFALLILAIGFYLYKTGDLQQILGKIGSRDTVNADEARKVIDIRYAAGQISAEEHAKLRNLI